MNDASPRLCEIKWIDQNGNPTPDTNPAVARVRTIDALYPFTE
jgi:hypothetical protein